MIYERLLRPLLFALDPETAHHFALACLRFTGPLCPRPTAKVPGVSAFGLNFRHRVGLAAGLDKNGVALPAWEALGFSFVEIGTVTSAIHSPRLKKNIGYAMVPIAFSDLGTEVEIIDPSGTRKARVVKKPFIDPGKAIPKA